MSDQVLCMQGRLEHFNASVNIAEARIGLHISQMQKQGRTGKSPVIQQRATSEIQIVWC